VFYRKINPCYEMAFAMTALWLLLSLLTIVPCISLCGLWFGRKSRFRSALAAQ
jgi:hypothetical protein